MKLQEWDLFKYNKQIYVVDKMKGDLIYSKNNPNNHYTICHISSVVKITEITCEYLNNIYDNLHPDFHIQLLEKI